MRNPFSQVVADSQQVDVSQLGEIVLSDRLKSGKRPNQEVNFKWITIGVVLLILSACITIAAVWGSGMFRNSIVNSMYFCKDFFFQ